MSDAHEDQPESVQPADAKAGPSPDALLASTKDELHVTIAALLPTDVREETKNSVLDDLEKFLQGKPVSSALLQHLAALSMEQCGRTPGRTDFANIHEVCVVDPNTAIIRMHYGRDNGPRERMSYWDIIRTYSHGETQDRNSGKGNGSTCGFFGAIENIERREDDMGVHIAVDVTSDRGKEKLSFDFSTKTTTA